MPNSTILWIILAAIIALALAAFQYFHKTKRNYKNPVLLTFLRFVSVFAVLILLVDPQINSSEFYTEKPVLVLAVDNSASVENFQQAEEVKHFVQEISQNKAINEKFDVQTFTFGRELRQNDSLLFTKTQTNIHNALQSLDELFKNTTAPTILITDGNQTMGSNFNATATNFNNSIFPVVVGDTVAVRDISISRVNVNKYTFLNNQFPVEVFVNYTGKQPAQSKLEISTGSSVIYSEEISLNGTNNSERIQLFLPASTIGVSTYKVEILPLAEEKNTFNNIKNVAVEVIDERTSVLLATKILHPDLGAIKKAIASNQQREVEIVQIGAETPDLSEYQLVILYQPDQEFERLFEEIQQGNMPYWLISGYETNWQFLNQVQNNFTKEITGQTEEFFPIINKNFSTFQIENLNFSQFPPLKASFGAVEFNIPTETILFQQMQGIETSNPLLFTYGKPAAPKAVLFGAGIWKWRSQSYIEQGSFEMFDGFMGSLVQFLASQENKDRLTVSYDGLYYGNQEIIITAQYFDENYGFDPGGQLTLELKNETTGKISTFPFILEDKHYEISLSNLPASKYNFKVSVAGENLSETGKFEMIEFNIEQQFNNANQIGLQQISDNFNVPLSYLNNSETIINRLLSNKNFAPVQKSRKNNVPLIDWFYLLGIIILSLSAEWFLRKYYGLI